MTVKSMRHRLCNNAGGGGGGGGALLYNLRDFSACRHKYVLDSCTCMFKDYKYVIEKPFNAFANRADPRSDSSYKSCLNRVYSVCLWKYDYM